MKTNTDNFTANQAGSSQSAAPTFRESFEKLHAAGFAVLPAIGKKPSWKYAGLTKRPSPKFLRKRPERFEGSDFVMIPGLTLMYFAGQAYRLIVLDGDDADAVAWIDRTFGWTPGKVKTRRGAHRYFLMPAQIELPTTLTNLRHLGINVDIKHGSRGAIVVVPPSRHSEVRDFQYAWDGCDETVLSQLPLFPLHILEQVLGQRLWALPGETSPVENGETRSETLLCPPGGHNGTSNGPPPPPPPPESETNVSGRFQLSGCPWFAAVGEGRLRRDGAYQGARARRLPEEGSQRLPHSPLL